MPRKKTRPTISPTTEDDRAIGAVVEMRKRTPRRSKMVNTFARKKAHGYF